MTTQHTPGPWTAADNSWEFSTVYGSDGKAVALCRISDDVTEETQSHFEAINEANARLIAAAPDLLTAWQRLLEYCDESDGSQYGTISTSLIRVLVKDAIAKATGVS